VSTLSDKRFTYSMDTLENYVNVMKLDCIAITNHNMFDLSQFNQIKDRLSIKVFPGIEIDLEGGHLLLISEDNELLDFSNKCRQIENKITNQSDSIKFSDLQEIFADLSRYILIPHYGKDPEIGELTLKKLNNLVTAGEVTSPKKFIYCIKDNSSLVPVLFSDLRMAEGVKTFPTRQTYVDIGDVTLVAIKSALRDKHKVFLSRDDGNDFFDALDNGLKLSTGLNVIIGERSTGKSYTLNRIHGEFENVKYIKQFSLLERDEEASSQETI
jgi:hypothetical protein